jgi:DNA-binding protein Fis
MNVGSGKNLYPTLMRAVERPLIELALRETNGNQLKAARLLG